MTIVCVIGAGGFIASWLVAKLLERGYKVRATVRDPDNDKKYGHLKKLEGASERLELCKADLLNYDSLVAAIRGCDGVFHTACPVAFIFDNPDDVLLPAIKGTENVMKACSEEQVKRVVMTSSAAAMTSGISLDTKVIDENCWSDPDSCRERKNWYSLAKTESEKLAWKIAEERHQDLVVICPVLVVGPLLQPSLNTSSGILKPIISGTYPENWVNIVDVRDTATAHILAFEKNEASGRYFCMAEVVACKDIVEIVKKNFPQVPSTDKSWPSFVLPSNRCNKKVVGLIGKFIPVEQSVVNAMQSLLDKGLL